MKKSIRDLENLKSVDHFLGEMPARGRETTEKGCSCRRVITLGLTILQREEELCYWV